MRRRLTVPLAVAIAVGYVCLLSPPSWAIYRDGWCRKGEGQTVVVEWTPPGGVSSPATTLIRCIALPGGSGALSTYPEEGETDLASPLKSAGIHYRLQGGLIVDVNNVPTLNGQYWHYVRGQEGGWLGNDQWFPEPIVDSFVGIRLTAAPAAPVPVPQFEPTPSPTPTAPDPGNPSEEPTGPGPGPTGEPSPEPSDQPSGDPSDQPSNPPTQPAPTQQPPTGTPSPPPTTGQPTSQPPPDEPPPPQPSRGTPTSSNPNDQPSSPDDQPSQPQDEPSGSGGQAAPPTSTPPPSGSPSPDPDSTVPDASPSPSRLWGRETSERQPSEVTPPRETNPWAPVAAVVAGLVLLGGLGSGFAGSLREQTGPSWEDE